LKGIRKIPRSQFKAERGGGVRRIDSPFANLVANNIPRTLRGGQTAEGVGSKLPREILTKGLLLSGEKKKAQNGDARGPTRPPQATPRDPPCQQTGKGGPTQRAGEKELASGAEGIERSTVRRKGNGNKGQLGEGRASILLL